jgi:hypothetical protein
MEVHLYSLAAVLLCLSLLSFSMCYVGITINDERALAMFEILAIAATCVTDYRIYGLLSDFHPRSMRDVGEFIVDFDYFPITGAVLPR